VCSSDNAGFGGRVLPDCLWGMVCPDIDTDVGEV